LIRPILTEILTVKVEKGTKKVPVQESVKSTRPVRMNGRVCRYVQLMPPLLESEESSEIEGVENNGYKRTNTLPVQLL
jgi:hypothetical protein